MTRELGGRVACPIMLCAVTTQLTNMVPLPWSLMSPLEEHGLT